MNNADTHLLYRCTEMYIINKKINFCESLLADLCDGFKGKLRCIRGRRIVDG